MHKYKQETSKSLLGVLWQLILSAIPLSSSHQPIQYALFTFKSAIIPMNIMLLIGFNSLLFNDSMISEGYRMRQFDYKKIYLNAFYSSLISG